MSFRRISGKPKSKVASPRRLPRAGLSENKSFPAGIGGFANQAIQSRNEELRSANEGLSSLNEELRNRNAELGTLNNNLTNLLGSVNIAVVMLGNDLRIRCFTPVAERVLNVVPADIGRPITDLKLNIDVADLETFISDCIERVTVAEREVQDRSGRWYSLQVRPHKTADSKVDGAVLTVQDIDALKSQVNESRIYAEAIVETVRSPLVLLDANLRVRAANPAFYQTFGVSPAETENRFVYDLGNGQWNIPQLRLLLEQIIPRHTEFAAFEVEREFPGIGRRTMLLNARQIRQRGSGAALILLGLDDITERRKAEDSLRELSGRLIQSQDEERRHIARELHDTTAQNMAALAMDLTLLKDQVAGLDPKVGSALSDSLDLAAQVSHELRTLSYLLHPPLLDEAGLGSAVRWYADGFAQRSGIHVDLDVSPQLGRMPREVETTLFRVIQECLSNVHRHSGSPTARIRVAREAGGVTVEVEDEGRGISPGTFEGITGSVTGLGVGLRGMRERVRQLGGQLQIDSASHGTKVRVVLPVSAST